MLKLKASSVYTRCIVVRWSHMQSHENCNVDILFMFGQANAEILQTAASCCSYELSLLGTASSASSRSTYVRLVFGVQFANAAVRVPRDEWKDFLNFILMHNKCSVCVFTINLCLVIYVWLVTFIISCDVGSAYADWTFFYIERTSEIILAVRFSEKIHVKCKINSQQKM